MQKIKVRNEQSLQKQRSLQFFLMAMNKIDRFGQQWVTEGRGIR